MTRSWQLSGETKVIEQCAWMSREQREAVLNWMVEVLCVDPMLVGIPIPHSRHKNIARVAEVPAANAVVSFFVADQFTTVRILGVTRAA